MTNLFKNKNNLAIQNPKGIVLLITLVLLVILSTLAYTFTTRVAAQRHRDQYIIDYSAARYACDSALKYALATLEDLDPQLISRPNEPDFSDLFAMSELQYKELLAQWSEQDSSDDRVAKDWTNGTGDNNSLSDGDYVNDVVNDFNYIPKVRGPYGPEWPLVTEPIEFEIGSAKVTIEIEDENAKYPISWMLLTDKQIEREATTGFEILCEWMGLADEEIDSFLQQLEDIAQLKPFKLDFKPITKTIREPLNTRITAARRRRAISRTRIRRKTISVSNQVERQNEDFAKLLHSSLIDIELLARPTIISESRDESVLKYTSLWASSRVNINTAPRHVLEAAFTFGGDADKIADEIIKARHIKPFEDIEDLRKSLFRYSDSISKCEKYITTTSTLFTVRVTAISGTAKAYAVAAITKNGESIKQVAVISG
jgi:hypothetical protein